MALLAPLHFLYPTRVSRKVLHLLGENIPLKTERLKKAFIAGLALSVSCFFGCDDDDGRMPVAMSTTGTPNGISSEGAANDIGNPEAADGTGDAGTASDEEGANDADTAGSSMGPSCETFAPCGGNAAGNWDFATECLPFVYPEPDDFCPDGSLEYVRTPLGTLSLRMDGTMSLNYGFRAQFVTTLPAACLNVTTCEELEASYNPDPNGAYPTSCAVNEAIAGCVCTNTFEEEPRLQNGIWAPLQDQNIIITLEGDAPQNALICADDDTLLIQPLEDENDTGMGPVFTLIRQ